MKNKKMLVILAVLIVLTFVLSACGGSNPMKGVANESGKIAGFWKGLWDGFTVIISFIISLFAPNQYGMYEVYNSGFGYNFGFALGILINFAAATANGRIKR